MKLGRRIACTSTHRHDTHMMAQCDMQKKRFTAFIVGSICVQWSSLTEEEDELDEELNTSKHSEDQLRDTKHKKKDKKRNTRRRTRKRR